MAASGSKNLSTFKQRAQNNPLGENIFRRSESLEQHIPKTICQRWADDDAVMESGSKAKLDDTHKSRSVSQTSSPIKMNNKRGCFKPGIIEKIAQMNVIPRWDQ